MSEPAEKFAGQRLLAMDPRTEQTPRDCPACHSTQSSNMGIKNELDILCCAACGSIYTPYYPWYSSAHYYADYYNSRNPEEPAWVVKRLEEITASFSPYRQSNQLLDVGCGAGTLLAAARTNGWNAQGVDVSESVAEHVRSRGFEVFRGELHEANFREGEFDVVTAAELVEHLFDPQKVLKEIHRILRPGGVLWTTTPHWRGLSARLLGLKWRVVAPPEHLQLFSMTGLRTLLSNAGFRNVQLTTSGGNPFEILQAVRSNQPLRKTASPAITSERVVEGYRLNEALTKSRTRRFVKTTINETLNVTHLGDTLKALAVK